MKSLLVILSSLFITTSALAFDDTTYHCLAKHSVKTVVIDVPDKQTVVLVDTLHTGMRVSCQFIDKATHQVLSNGCYVSTDTAIPMPVVLKITNNNDRSVEFNIDIHSIGSR